MKQFFTFLGIVAMGATAYGQADTDIVNIPDERFKKYLIENRTINTNRDTEISYGEARAYTGKIEVSDKRISSLVGIEAFVNITELYCSYNQLTNLDVSKNTALYYLSCSENQLTNLDVSKNTALKYLSCSDNQLTQLNLANGNNNNWIRYTWISMEARNNPNLKCIQIDTGVTPRSSWTKDNHASYSDNCNYPTLSTTEVKAENAIQILNPVKDNLIIKTTAKIESIEIYNTAGQLVKVLFKGNTQVQDLAKGVYIAKVHTNQGTHTLKIVK